MGQVNETASNTVGGTDGSTAAHRMSEDTLVTLNAELLDDKDAFSYRDIQQLCVRLGLGGSGKREVLVAKLRTWHRARSPAKLKSPKKAKQQKQQVAAAAAAVALQRLSSGGNIASSPGSSGGGGGGCGGLVSPAVSEASPHHHPMNVPGQRFAMLHINVVQAAQDTRSSGDAIKRSSSGEKRKGEDSCGGGENDDPSAASAVALKAASAKKKKRRSSLLGPIDPADLLDSPSGGGSSGGNLGVSPRLLKPLIVRNDVLAPKSALKSPAPKTSRKSLLFSPYNGVRLIPHRLEPDALGSPKDWEKM